MTNKIGSYKIIKEISEGGMAVVYLAIHQATGKKVAIKLLKERLIAKEKIAQRFSQEGLLKLDHPHIVKIHSIGTHNNTPYIVMDYIEGTDLEEYIKKRGKLSLDVALNIFTQILKALSYVHRKGIIHRDIKPKNILIDKNDIVKLTDFGIAKSLYSHIKTSTGGYLGAPAYSSPEQMDGKRVDARSDIYSLGITLYQMLTGNIPYSSSSIEIIIKEKFLNQIIPIEKRRKNIPPYIVSIINKCISKNPSNRFSSVEEIIKVIKPRSYNAETIVKSQKELIPKEKAGHKSNLKKSKKTYKRPISIILVSILGGSFFILLIALISTISINPPVINSIYGVIAIYFLIFTFISLALLLINRRKNIRRTKGFIIATTACFVMIPLFFTLCSTSMDLIPSVDETLENNNVEARSTVEEPAVEEKFAVEEEIEEVEASKEESKTEDNIDVILEEKLLAPTIKLVIYEGPTYSEANDLCYYRVEAVVTGDSVSYVEFSKDDSSGAWGTKKTQINLSQGESYILTANVTNSEGSASDLIELNWGCDEVATDVIGNHQLKQNQFLVDSDYFNVSTYQNFEVYDHNGNILFYINIYFGDVDYTIGPGYIGISVLKNATVNPPSKDLILANKNLVDKGYLYGDDLVIIYPDLQKSFKKFGYNFIVSINSFSYSQENDVFFSDLKFTIEIN